jgi:acyl-CoA reductase-like NAD-dependent aldehyde dehydrogenase
MINSTDNRSKAAERIMRTQPCAVMINKAWDFHPEHLPFDVIKDSGFGLLATKSGFAAMSRLEVVVV